jgi:hypothetical protein
VFVLVSTALAVFVVEARGARVYSQYPRRSGFARSAYRDGDRRRGLPTRWYEEISVAA